MADFGFEFWKRVDGLLEGRSLTTLADSIGMNYATMKNQRSGNRYPKRDDVQRIADYLNTSVNYLMTGEKSVSSEICNEAMYVQQHPEARALIRAIMDDPALLYPISALVTRKAPEEKKEHA